MAQDRKQDIDLGITRPATKYEDSRYAVLTIDTGKSYTGGIRSTATVFWIGEHSRSHAFGLGSPKDGDFSRRMRVCLKVRATQAAIDKQHAEVFTPEAVAELTAHAKAFYAEVSGSAIPG